MAFFFRDLEKLTVRLAEKGVRLLPMNPVTQLIDEKCGRTKERYQEIRDERALSAIVEFKLEMEKGVEILRYLQDFSREIETVFSVGIISRCEDGRIPFKNTLDKAGIDVATNGKTCLGFGRIPI